MTLVMGHLRDMNGMKAIKADCMFHFAHRIWMSFFLSHYVSFCYVLHCFTCVCCQSHGGERMYICREMCHVPPSFHWVPRRRQWIWKGEGQRQLRENEDIAQRGQGIACTPGPFMTRFVGTRGAGFRGRRSFLRHRTLEFGVVYQDRMYTRWCLCGRRTIRQFLRSVGVCMGTDYSVNLHFVGDSGRVLCVSSGSWRYLCVAEGALGGLCFVNFCCCPSQQEGHIVDKGAL